MSKTTRRLRSAVTTVVATAITVTGLAVAGTMPALAAPAPMQPAATNQITADALPTVQVDGVVWSQAVVGNTVWAGGKFNNARPAGAAAGTQLTPRSNLLAYNITTGALITLPNTPSLSAQVLSVSASPDGKRVYVVGDFTSANGVARRRVAAYDTSTGALITSFNPSGPNSQAKAVVATNDAVYVGGGFLTLANSTVRNNLVGYRAADGATLPWNPNADYTVWALAKSADGSAVFAGGSFQNVGGQPAYGLAKIATSDGALDTGWKGADTVRNAGKDAGVTSLNVQNGFVYGTTYHFGPGGNIEGTFKAPVDTGVVEWVTDCHGDNYSSFVNRGAVYVAGHSHYCGNMGGGFPQYSTWRFQHAVAWTDTVGGDILNDVHGYPNWHGVKPGPSMINWLPDMGIGSATGQYQAGWNVTGNSDYVVFGGEFPSVNGVGQQGLVRFSVRPNAPAKESPRFVGNAITPTLVPVSPNSVRVTFPAGFDRDSRNLRYRVYRTGVSVPRYDATVDSNWWTMPAVGFVDTGLTPGQTYSYRVQVNDADGNTVNGATASVAVPTSVPASTAYADTVRSNGARIYWPLNETGGTTVFDRAASPSSPAGVGVTDGRSDTGVNWNQTGAIAGDSAASLGDNDSSRVFAGNCATTAGCNWGTETAPDTFTSQVWVKTTTTRGGRILGFGDLQNGGSGHRDRHVYMDNAGRLLFEVKAQDGSVRTVSSAKSYNDDQWHMITATMSPAGMVLYVDGARVARRTDTTQGESYLGYWRLGGDNLLGGPSQPNTVNFIGTVDEVAVYPTALSQDQVLAQYAASGRTASVPSAPGDALGKAVYDDDPDLYWRLGESSGTTAADSGRGGGTGTYRNGVTLGADGVVAGNTAARFDGNNQFVSSDASVSNPLVYSEEAWFNTTTNRGGKIIGFGSEQAGSSGGYDRHVYMQDDGKLVFGVWTGQTNTVTTPGAYNDGTWHHVVATQSGEGLKLYVDGVLIGTNPQTQAQDYTGYWKVGGDNTWGSSSAYFDGRIDEVAVYSKALAADRVTAHFLAGGGKLNVAPTAAFGSDVQQRRAAFDASGSTDPDGSIASYAWDFGDNTTGSGVNPVHVYGASGTYTVKLTVSDNKGAISTISHDITVTASATPADKYGAAVTADKPRLFWRVGETSGNVAADASGALSGGHYYNGYTLGQPGALPITNTAVAFDGNGGFLSSDDVFDNPTTYTQEAWFKTTTTRGGKIIGFGRNQTGSSSSYDRHVYMQDDGHLVFGTYTGQLNTITTPAAYNNGEWHQVVASQGPDGMKLYVDGALIGTNPQTGAENYPGYWKVGGDNTWGSSSAYFDGTIDEVAVYLSVLSGDRVAAHYAAAAPAPNEKPTAAFTSTKTNLAVDVDASTSTDTDGTIAGYAWDFGDGWAGTGPTTSHTYAAAGTYTIKLTVTDDDGATDTVSHDVTVKPANVAPTARFGTTVDHLDLAVDAGTTTDPDGTVAGYAWDFGDGQSGTGKTTTHRYTQAGTYTVTLTVTDNDGATDTVTHDVVATDPPNQAPNAEFSSSTADLVLSVNAGPSTDVDGTVTGWAWDFGDGKTGTGKTTTHTYTAAGTYTVKLTVTDDKGATGTVSHDVTVSAANQSPTASFGTTVTNLKVAVDATASNDPDGTIAGYAWDFGDNKTGTGATTSHTYTAAGPYTITLTVTDNKGATSTTTRQVTVAPAPNQAPTARFTSTSADLTASFDGSTSSDPDGTVASYSWSFGDNTAGTGAKPTHAYGGPGTYTVTLTVTDNQGATGTVSQTVTVTAPTTLAADGFDRTVTNGWGTADNGGAWTTSTTTTNFNVINGAGTIRTTTSAGPAAYLNGISAGDVDVTASIGYDKPGTGGGTYTALVARRVGTSDYRAKVRIVGSTTYLYLARTVNNAETVVASQTINGLSYADGDTFNVRFQAQGAGTTTLRAKVWKAGTSEPGSWQLTAADTAAGLQAPGAVGIWSYLSGSSTNSPVTLRVEDFRVRPLP